MARSGQREHASGGKHDLHDGQRLQRARVGAPASRPTVERSDDTRRHGRRLPARREDARTGRRRRPSTQGETAQHVPPDAVDLPGPWTPAERRADSRPWRGGRPPAVGNLAEDRRRPCLRWGREIPTAPQRFIIIYHQIPDRRRGRDFGTGIHLNEAIKWSKRPGPPQPTTPDHVGSVQRLPGPTTTQG